jgi:hypothetical protein
MLESYHSLVEMILVYGVVLYCTILYSSTPNSVEDEELAALRSYSWRRKYDVPNLKIIL